MTYAPKITKRRFHMPTMVLTLAACIIIGAIAAVVIWRNLNWSPVPAAISAQLHFPTFTPARYVAIDATSYKYDPGQGVFSFRGKLDGGQPVTFAEQPTPSSFSDIPDFYTKFLQTMYEYQSFDSLSGTVYLAHPKGAGQVAIMNSKGTLLFASVGNDQSTEMWQHIFNNLSLFAPK